MSAKFEEPLDPEEMREYVIDAWCMVVAKRVSAAYLAGLTGQSTSH